MRPVLALGRAEGSPVGRCGRRVGDCAVFTWAWAPVNYCEGLRPSVMGVVTRG